MDLEIFFIFKFQHNLIEEKIFFNSNLPNKGFVSTDRSMVAALLNTTPRPVTKSSANDSTPRP
jgi:hypothetical protein